MRFGQVFTGSLKDFAKHIQNDYDEVVANFDQYEFEPDRAEYYIDFFADGSWGIYQAGRVIDILSIRDEAEEYLEEDDPDRITNLYDPEVWDDVIFPAMDELTGDIEKRILPLVKQDPNYPITAVSYGWSEGGGDFGISIIVEIEG